MFDYLFGQSRTHGIAVLSAASLLQEIAAAFKQVDEKTGADRAGCQCSDDSAVHGHSHQSSVSSSPHDFQEYESLFIICSSL